MTPDAAGEMLHNIFAAPAEPGPPYTHTFAPLQPDPAQAVAWLRKQIEQRRYLAQRTVELGNAVHWTELSSGVLMTIAADAPQDNWDGVHPMGDSSLTRLMEANDPQDTIARCQAELAMLDICQRVIGEDEGHEYYSDGWSGLAVARIAIRFLAAAYRHHDGYAQFWGGPAPTHTITEAGQ